jgi:hypothetical protein
VIDRRRLHNITGLRPCQNCNELTVNGKGVCKRCMSRSADNNYGTINGRPLTCPVILKECKLR